MERDEGRKIHNEINNYLETIDFLNESTDDYLFLWDFKTGNIYFSGGIHKKYNLPETEDHAVTVKDWEKIVYSRDLSAVQENLRKVINGEKDSHNMEYRLVDREKNRVWISCRGKCRMSEDGSPEMMIGRVSDTVMGQRVDSLTGLLNAERFSEDMEKCLEEDKKGYLMILGVDNLKNINIKYGRAYGNHVLKVVTEIIEEVVDVSLSIYRLDGDRYAVNIEERNRQEVEEMYTKIQEKTSSYCTLSAGVVSYGEEIIEDSGTLYQYAEDALDRAKQMGKNKLVFFSAEDYEKNLTMIDLQDELRYSIQHDFCGFFLCYQPQVDGTTYKIFGAEALLRYESPSRGQISPEEFVPILEHTELIVPVGEWVLKTALAQCREWRKYLPNLHISVNMSYIQLRKEEIAEKVLELLKQAELPGEALTLEMTESMQLQDYAYFNKTFYLWRKHGIDIAIDDFGTGYSSLGYLKSLETNEIKIDRCFVSRLNHSAYNYRLISNMIELAHSAQIRVCCEGVETEEELLVLKELKADLLQGYLFARPYQPEEFEAYYIHSDSPLYRLREEKESHFREIYATEDQKIMELESNRELGGIIEGMDEVIYVSDLDSYELYYLNPAGRILTGVHDYKGHKCYKVLQGRNDPCEFCTNCKLRSDGFYVWENDNVFLKRHFILKDKLIPWNGKMVRMEIAIDITEKEIISQELQKKLDFEQNIVTCTKILVEESDMDEAIDQVLELVGEFYKADRAYIFEPDEESPLWSNTYEWCRDGVEPQKKELQHISADFMSWCVDTFHKGESLVVLNVDSMKKDRPDVWKILEKQGVRRLLAAPMWKNKKLLGFIGVDNPKYHHVDDAQIYTMAYFLADRIQRDETETRLSELLEFNKEDVLKKTRLGLWVIRLNPETGYGEMYGDKVLRLVMGASGSMTPHELYQHWYGRINDGYYEYVNNSVQQMIDSGEITELEYTWNHPEMGEMTVRCLGIRIEDKDGMVCLEGYHRIFSEINKPTFLNNDVTSETFEYNECKQSIYFHSSRELLAGNQQKEENFPECWIESELVHPDFAEQFRSIFHHVEEQEELEGREIFLKTRRNIYEWFRLKTQHLSMLEQDQKTIVVQLTLANREWNREQEYLRNRSFYEAFLAETEAFAEVDVAKDEVKSSGGLWASYKEECSQNKITFRQLLERHCRKYLTPKEYGRVFDFIEREMWNLSSGRGVPSRRLSFQEVRNGKVQWLELVIHVFQEEYTDKMYALLYLKDVDIDKKRQINLEKAANMDPLTNVYNRRSFEAEVQSYMTQSGSKPGGAMVILDLDDFKATNDAYGHSHGDLALQTLTQILVRTFRHGDLIGRLGGDEFLVFIKNVREKSVLGRRMETLFSELQQVTEVPLTCSVGITFAEQDPQRPFSYAESLKQADEALYESKKRGKNQYCYYDELLHG